MKKNNFFGLNLQGLEQAILKNKCTIKIFCDENSMRIVEVMDRVGTIQACSRHINLIPALIYANDDYRHNGNYHDYIMLEYEGEYEGSSISDSFLDYLIMNECLLVIKNKDGFIETSLKNYVSGVILTPRVLTYCLVDAIASLESSLSQEKCDQFLLG